MPYGQEETFAEDDDQRYAIVKFVTLFLSLEHVETIGFCVDTLTLPYLFIYTLSFSLQFLLDFCMFVCQGYPQMAWAWVEVLRLVAVEAEVVVGRLWKNHAWVKVAMAHPAMVNLQGGVVEAEVVTHRLWNRTWVKAAMVHLL
jgi:hypothetical protein